jgi:hypothetical protein
MGRGEAQLGPGEQVLFRTRLHPMAFSGAAGLAASVLVIVVLLIRHNDLPFRTEAEIALVGLLVAVVGAIPATLRWLRTRLVLTNQRVLLTAGGFRTRHAEAPLAAGVVEQEAGLTGRLFDHGTITIVRPEGLTSIGHVAHARELAELARTQARRVPRRGTTPG